MDWLLGYDGLGRVVANQHDRGATFVMLANPEVSSRLAKSDAATAWVPRARTDLGPERWAMINFVYGAGLTQRQIAIRLGQPESHIASEIAAGLQMIAATVLTNP